MPTRPAMPRQMKAAAAPLARLFDVEAASGILLLGATVLALLWANSPWRHGYESFWQGRHSLTVLGYAMHGSYVQVVNDGFMALFFFVVGLEIKRELVAGELRDRRAAALPAIAALGGMVVPIAVYVAITAGGHGAHGWGIPMATDIAFALAVLVALGPRVPRGLKVFLLTLAVVDDIGAIVVIALFYASDIRWVWLALAFGLFAGVVALRRGGVGAVWVYTVVGLVAWFAMWRSGVHPTVAGVVLGLLTPAAGSRRGPDQSVAARLEARLHPWSGYVVIPVFALANAGVAFGSGFQGDGRRVLLGVGLGLLVGKPIGVAGATWLTVRAGLADLPAGVRWAQVLGVGAVAGIGFTVSLFVTDLAFTGAHAGELGDHAKVAVLLASAVSALIGASVLAVSGRDNGEPEGAHPYDV